MLLFNYLIIIIIIIIVTGVNGEAAESSGKIRLQQIRRTLPNSYMQNLSISSR